MGAERSGRRIASIIVCVVLSACQAAEKEVDVDRVMQEADQLYGERRFLEGLDTMRLAVDAHPEDASIQLRYGQALISAGQPSLAVWPLSRAIRDPEHLVPAGLVLARAQSWAGSGLDAVRSATRVLEADPDNEEALLIRIGAYLSHNLEEGALEDLDHLDGITEDPTAAVMLRLDALLGLAREGEAAELLNDLTARAESMREEAPASAARMCAAMATFSQERGQIEEAKKQFDGCLETHGTGYAVLVRAAIEFYDEIDKEDRATSIFQRQFEESPDRLDLRVRYANRLQHLGRKADAETLLLEAAETQPRAWAALADFYALAGDIRRAVDALDRVISANPELSEDWLFSRADFLLAVGEIDEAEATLSKLKVPAHRALLAGRIAASRGNLEGAARDFEEGIRLWPDNPDARYLAGQVYERMGEWTRAASHYREAARMEQPHYASSLALAELQSALGDMEGVSFLLSRLAGARPDDVRIMERFLEFAWDTGSVELGGNLLRRLSRVPGQAAHTTAIVTRRVALAEGPAKALETLDKSGLDVHRPRHFEGLEVRVELLVELDRAEDAVAGIKEAIRIGGDSARLRVLRATVYRALGETEAAAEALRAARAMDGSYLPALMELADLEAERGHVGAARDLYAAAIPIEASHVELGERNEARAAIELARLDLEAEEVEAARERLRAVLDENPRQGTAAWMLFESYEGGRGLSREERADLVLRASVFAHNREAQEIWATLNANAARS